MEIKIRRVCAPTDFSELSELAISYGIALAEQFKAELHLVYVAQDPREYAIGEFGALPPDFFESELKRSMDRLASHPKQAVSKQVKVIRVVKEGLPFQQICRYAKDESVDLLVMGTHGRTGLSHLLLGSTAEKVIRLSPCPVLTVRDPERQFIA